MEERRPLRLLVPAVLVGTAALLMLVRLGEPSRIIFDETYYVNDARDMLEHGVEDGFVVHPPVGKLLIATSIRLFGDTPFGWRAVGALLAVATVALTYLIGRRLFGRLAPAALAALLVAVDGVFLVQARTAMLDIHLAFFVALGAWALVRDRDHVRAADDALLRALGVDPTTRDREHGAASETVTEGETDAAGEHDAAVAVAATDDPTTDEPGDEPSPARLPRPHRWWLALAGVAFGLAVGVKWSGALALGAAGLLALAWEIERRRRVTGHWYRQSGRGVATLGLALVVLPVAAYAVTWVPWLLHFEDSYEGAKVCDTDPCGVGLPGRLAALGRFHVAIKDFHVGLEADHPYRAPAYAWPLQARPVVYYYETCSEDRFNRVPSENDDGELETPEPCRVNRGEAGEMLAVGNPALWWLFLPASALLVAGWVRRDRRSSVPMLFWLAQFLPWLIVSRPVFSFYTVPFVPFLALGTGAALTHLYELRPAARVWTTAAIGALLGGGAVGVLDLTAGDYTRPTYGVAIGAGWALGAALGGWWSRGVVPLPRTPRAARWATAIVGVLAVALAVYFLPVWIGIALDDDLIRQRWWFRGWI